MNASNKGRQFCFECGCALDRQWNAADRQHRLTCAKCGHVHYDNPKVLVWCHVICGDKVLMCKRAMEPAIGLWNPPAGFVEAGETLQEAISRELSEEAGVVLTPDQWILNAVVNLPHMNQIYIGFVALLDVEPTISVGAECSEAHFFGEADMPTSQLAFSDMIPETTAEFFARIRARNFAVQLLTLRRR
jgi:ADP-ribose pyrophosphatase YjhB (NUDIX family)